MCSIPLKLVRDGAESVVVRDVTTFDQEVNPYMVGMSVTEIDDEASSFDRFDCLIRESLQKWNGGPATLEECLAWDGRTVWVGSNVSLLSPSGVFVLEDVYSEERRRMFDSYTFRTKLDSKDRKSVV